MPGGSFSADIAAIRERARQTDDDPATRGRRAGILAAKGEHADVVELLAG